MSAWTPPQDPKHDAPWPDVPLDRPTCPECGLPQAADADEEWHLGTGCYGGCGYHLCWGHDPELGPCDRSEFADLWDNALRAAASRPKEAEVIGNYP